MSDVGAAGGGGDAGGDAPLLGSRNSGGVGDAPVASSGGGVDATVVVDATGKPPARASKKGVLVLGCGNPPAGARIGIDDITADAVKREGRSDKERKILKPALRRFR